MAFDESGRDDLLDRLVEEFAARLRRGERPALKEFTDRYPELADEIRDVFPAIAQVEQAKEICQDWNEADGADSTPPTQVGDYRIVREIGRGGMGIVYEAEQVSLGRRVALKVLPSSGARDRTTLARFRREARASARLHHTNIVPVFDVGQDGDVRYYAMQFIHGQSLDAVIAELRRLRGRLRIEDVGRLALGSRERGQLGDERSGRSAEESRVARSLLTGQFQQEGGRSFLSRRWFARSRGLKRARAEVLDFKGPIGHDAGGRAAFQRGITVPHVSSWRGPGRPSGCLGTGLRPRSWYSPPRRQAIESAARHRRCCLGQRLRLGQGRR